jgi:hypothetical protein
MDGKDVVVCNVEGEVAGLAIECRVAADSKAFGLIEDDVGVLMSEACVEPGKAAAGEPHLSRADGLEGGVGGCDISLKLPFDLRHVAFKGGDEGDKEWSALRRDDLRLMLRPAIVLCCFVALLPNVLCEVCDPLFAHACDYSCNPVALIQSTCEMDAVSWM